MTRKSHARRNRDHAPKPVTIHQFFTDRISDVRKGFRTPVRITIMVTHAEGPDGITVFGDDNLDQLISGLQAKRDEFVASQQASTEVPAHE